MLANPRDGRPGAASAGPSWAPQVRFPRLSGDAGAGLLPPGPSRRVGESASFPDRLGGKLRGSHCMSPYKGKLPDVFNHVLLQNWLFRWVAAGFFGTMAFN